MNKLYAKIMFKGSLDILTGLHIGGSDDFAAIGAIDNSVIKDSITNLPIIPGSSLKGKLRYLLSRIKSKNYVLNKIDDEDITIKRLFGSGNSNNQIVSSRLQFFDLTLNEENAEMLKNADTDLYVTEAKFENSIDRITAVANPR
ncbi:type III-A CRISPR-associated RAMP protein Csm3 [Anaerofustis butyriciformans]|uniref:type III-A CRISPR-associated RAMP protein Csm3 n=1 Tax=Anaerofustis butyriciformans TaxID=3108533 RepID=UPI003F88AD55